MADLKALHVIQHWHGGISWFLDEREESQRSAMLFKVAVDYVLKHPGSTFVMDQVPLIRAYLDRFPDDLPVVRRLIDEGRIELVNGFYHEADCNLPGGEGLVRQGIYGQRWNEKTFGRRAKISWQIDPFGFPASLPQILKECDMHGFVFERGAPFLSLQQSEFLWRGLDGTSILAHWMPYEYPAGCQLGMTNNLQKEFEFVRTLVNRLGKFAATENALCPVGHDFSEPNPCMKSVVDAWNVENPNMSLSFSTPSAFFNSLQGRDLPTVERDFNPIFPGCYSFRIHLKQLYRACENGLMSLEKLAVMAKKTLNLDVEWENLLLNQFHDAITGCGCDRIYPIQERRYNQVRETINTASVACANEIAGSIRHTQSGEPVVVFNTLSWERSELVMLDKFPEPCRVVDVEGKEIPVQRLGNKLAFIARVPSMGYTTYYLQNTASREDPNEQAAQFLKTDEFAVVLDNEGDISQINDLRDGQKLLNTDWKSNHAHTAGIFPRAHENGQIINHPYQLTHVRIPLDHVPKSMTLPNHPDVKLMAATVGKTPVELPYNEDGISWDSNKLDGNLRASSANYVIYTYPVSLRADDLPQNRKLYCHHDGQVFKLGPYDDGAKNMLSCLGQTIPLSGDGDLHLLFLCVLPSVDNFSGSCILHFEKEEITVPIELVFWRDSALPPIEQPNGNQISVYSDQGHAYWSMIGKQVASTRNASSKIRLGKGSVLTRAEITGEIDGSPVIREIIIPHGLGKILFRTTIDWRGVDRTVYVHFPFVGEGRWTHEVPYGVQERPDGHWPVQNWIDWGTDQHGVTLVNKGLADHWTCKGQAILTLLRSVGRTVFGEELSRTGMAHGRHIFEYALVPRNQPWLNSKTFRAGWELNTPLVVALGSGGGEAPARKSYASIDDTAMITVWNGDQVRLWSLAEGKISLSLEGWQRADHVNALGDFKASCPATNGVFQLNARPGELITLAFQNGNVTLVKK